MDINHEFFENKFKIENDVHVLNNNDDYSANFGKQWKKYTNTQIDSINNFKISYNLINDLFFNNMKLMNDKNILEIGSGAGRFTEIIIDKAKSCTTVDMSAAIFYNVSKSSTKLTRIKANFIDLKPKKKFDIVICRGVLQHTPDPYKYLEKLFDFIDNNGVVVFDIYSMPKIKLLHPKYLIWRPLFLNFIKYSRTEIFLNKNISLLLRIKRFIKKILFNSSFLSDCIMPIWDYKDKIELNEKQLQQWSILDTLDGLYAKYDKPKTNKSILNFLFKKNKKIINNNTKKNYFIVSN